MLASDMANREFIGAQNPDDLLAVQFYIRPVPNEHLSRQEGRPIYEDVPHVKIFSPGNTLNIIDAPVKEEHKMRFPRQWAIFQNSHGEDTRNVGTPISQWPRITPAQAEELRALKFFTVEQIAGASDDAINKVGMLAGTSPYSFRELAKNFLAVAKGEAEASKSTLEVEKLREEMAAKDAAHAEELRQIREQMAVLASDKARPGRPPKEKAE